jgi:ketosteroid isomerase-like protein
MTAFAAGIALVRKIYAAINRNDIPAAIEAFDPEIERIEPDGFPAAGTYRGHAALAEHLSRGRDTWAEGGCEVEEIIVVGDMVVAFVHARVRLKDRADWVDGRFADVFAFRNGKAVLFRSFGERQAALAWVSAAPQVTR